MNFSAKIPKLRKAENRCVQPMKLGNTLESNY